MGVTEYKKNKKPFYKKLERLKKWGSKMSDKITKTVTYEINSDGDCRKCKSRRGLYQCIAFDIDVKWTGSEYINCQACKDYLAQEKAKVRCDNCKYFIYDWMESECTKGNENTCGETFARDDWYYDNCQDREE